MKIKKTICNFCLAFICLLFFGARPDAFGESAPVQSGTENPAPVVAVTGQQHPELDAGDSLDQNTSSLNWMDPPALEPATEPSSDDANPLVSESAHTDAKISAIAGKLESDDKNTAASAYYSQPIEENSDDVKLDAAGIGLLEKISDEIKKGDEDLDKVTMPLTSEFILEETLSEKYNLPADDTEEQRKFELFQELKKIDKNAPQDRKPVLPDLSSKTEDSVINIEPLELIETVLWANPGIFLGEAHDDNAPPAFMIENMSKLKEMGVEVLFLEMVYSRNQKLIDDYYKDDAALDKLKASILEGWSDHGKEAVERYVEIIKAAKKAGVKVVAIDVPYVAEPYSSFERLVTSNAQWYKTIKQYLKDNEVQKYIVYGGTNHSAAATPKGIDYMLGIPSIDFKMGEAAFVARGDDSDNNYEITLK